MQTRFATTALALLRAHLGHDLSVAIADARAVLDQPLPAEPPDSITSCSSATAGPSAWPPRRRSNSARPVRRWAEAYPAMEYRHGPISVAGPGSLVWFVGEADPDLARDVRATGATVVTRTHDPMAELVALQRGAVALAEAKGLDPDNPQHLTRSVVLG